jgi:3-oxoacyl-[acyl-carrier-protein] synthase II
LKKNNPIDRHRVVVTGIGVISPIGCDIDSFWNGLLKGQSGIRRISSFDPSGLPCHIAGEVPDFIAEDYLERKEIRRISRVAQIAYAAARQAVTDANLPPKMHHPERAGVVFGTAIGGLDRVDEGIQVLRSQGFARVNPFTITSGIPNLGSFLVAAKFGCLGPNNTVTTACAAGTQAIGEGAELIRRGAADIVIAGGSEALIKDFTIAGFCAMRALPTSYNHDPQKASRPFDASREGFVFSEGAAVLVLEEYNHAKKRDAKTYCEIVGYASSSDGFSVAAPDPSANGPARAIRWALEDAAISTKQIDYINAHGTGTLLNDPTETKAIKKIFGEDAYQTPISSTKSMIGHAMGASGAIEGIVCVLSITHNIAHPTINLDTPDPECDLDYIPEGARKFNINYVLSNSFGLGGQNACIVMKGNVE